MGNQSSNEAHAENWRLKEENSNLKEENQKLQQQVNELQTTLKSTENLVSDLNDLVCDAYSTRNQPIPMQTQNRFMTYMMTSQNSRTRQRDLENEIAQLRQSRTRVGNEALALRQNLDRLESCIICTEPYDDEDHFRVALKPCGHILGKSCHEDWGTGRCPYHCNGIDGHLRVYLS
ncbi:Oidioi.mRNA.OKI2018_I69.PAR.g10851.t1.cds [Oikopleura dioica]|uniref:Oidioi.mRNA.OKI2018_I69.PAR.g10851.t1.cds n=1 Tax=Oikopleura dioica TaxID=34765 RepID=A0ABN7RWB2_OIKDI|nr:Oidioi.mRNA.OKI2018_I69.PAR.g10851.t1.cds [Oikopleura dioica]